MIAKLHASAHEHVVNKEARRSMLVMPTTAETRPREEMPPKRRTPLKRNKTSHKEAENKSGAESKEAKHVNTQGGRKAKARRLDCGET